MLCLAYIYDISIVSPEEVALCNRMFWYILIQIFFIRAASNSNSSFFLLFPRIRSNSILGYWNAESFLTIYAFFRFSFELNTEAELVSPIAFAISDSSSSMNLWLREKEKKKVEIGHEQIFGRISSTTYTISVPRGFSVTWLDVFAFSMRLAVAGVLLLSWSIRSMQWTLLITGTGDSIKTPSEFLEYVLNWPFICTRGAGFRVGGSLVICPRLIGTNVGVAVGVVTTFIDWTVLVVGGGIDFLNTDVLCTVTVGIVVTTLFRAGSGRCVAFDVGTDNTTFWEPIRCTLITPFGPFIWVGAPRRAISGFGRSFGNLEYGNDSLLATTGAGALRCVIDWFKIPDLCNGTLMLRALIAPGLWLLTCRAWVCSWALDLRTNNYI